MDPIIFEFLGGLLVGAMAGLMVVLRIKHPAPKMMPKLAVKRTRSAALVHRRKTSRIRDRSTVTFAKRRKKGKKKTPDPPTPSKQTLNNLPAIGSFDTWPS